MSAPRYVVPGVRSVAVVHGPVEDEYRRCDCCGGYIPEYRTEHRGANQHQFCSARCGAAFHSRLTRGVRPDGPIKRNLAGWTRRNP